MFLLLVASAAIADLPAGDPVAEAAAVQVGTAGLDTIADVLPALLPAEPIAVSPMSQSSGGFCFEYSYEMSNLWVEVSVLDAAITPSAGVLTVDADLLVSVNDATDPFTLLLDAICLIDEDCSGWIDPFAMSVSVPLTLDVLGPPGGKYVDATVGSVAITDDLTLNELQTDCAVNDIEQVLNFFGLSIFDLVIGLFEDTLVEQVETTLDEALAAAAFDDVLEIGGATVDVRVEPADIVVTNAGVELVMASQIDGVPADCIADFDPGVSASSGGPRPAVGSNPPGTHLAAHLAGDALNQALYAFWRGGLLCQQVGGSDLDIGIAVDTTLLGLIGGAPYQELFPEPAPMEIVVVPHQAPVVQPAGAHDLNLEVRELELAFMAELDGRMARALGVAVDADVGADVLFDDLSGELSVALDLGEDALTPTLAGDLMVPGAEQEVLDNFGSVVSGLLDTLLDGLVGDALAFALPTFGDLGLTSLDVGASGADGDWVGAYASLGTVTYADPYAEGCGCSSEGGEACGGCTVQGGGAAGWLFAAVLVALRRRR